MTAVQKIGAAEAAPHATPSRALPSPGMPGRATLSHDASLYYRKLSRVLSQMGGTHTLQDILVAIAENRMQSFTEGDSWIITQVATFPRVKALEVFAAVGNLDELRILHDRILDFADEINAGVIRAYGRRGWLPDAAARGWRVKSRHFVYQKDC